MCWAAKEPDALLCLPLLEAESCLCGEMGTEVSGGIEASEVTMVAAKQAAHNQHCNLLHQK